MSSHPDVSTTNAKAPAASRAALQTRQSFCMPVTSSASDNSGPEHGDRQHSMRPGYPGSSHQSMPSHCNSGWSIQAHLGYTQQSCETNTAAGEPDSRAEDMCEDDHDSDDQQADRRQGGNRPRKPHLQVRQALKPCLGDACPVASQQHALESQHV